MTETQRTINDWGLATFGHASALEIGARMGMEQVELLEFLASGTPDDALHSLLGEQRRLAREINARVNALVQRGEEMACLDCPAAVEECADINIMNLQIIDRLGGDCGRATDAKMARNRRRDWQRLEDGTMQHVEGT